MCILSAKIRAAAHGKNILTYAMLNNCSQGSFVQEALVQKMQTPGRKTILNLKTLNGERSESTKAIEGLQVAGSKNGSTLIKLPRIYTRKHLPVDKKEVATSDKIEEWNYLKTISSEITQTDDIEVGLLIGTNCIKVLEPLTLIAINNGGPYAYQTRLGWCIVGPIGNMVDKDSIGYHRIAVQYAISSKTADHQFVVEESMKDISLEEMLQEMHQNDFVEKKVFNVNGLLENMVEISKDGKAFLKTDEKLATKSGDHYVVKLPFKKENLIIPNNRKLVMQRLIYLKRRFKKDTEFFEDYKQFMSNLLVKEYAKRMDDSPVGKTWYMPHNAVYIPGFDRVKLFSWQT